ncbi:hypothetical protein C8R45DRAFT_1159703 [Mycena sanguinolenta]|nr:hypothetical protein C8R45DRAFT_1159703 [Mycena sanguinolenta]
MKRSEARQSFVVQHTTLRKHVTPTSRSGCERTIAEETEANMSQNQARRWATRPPQPKMSNTRRSHCHSPQRRTYRWRKKSSPPQISSKPHPTEPSPRHDPGTLHLLPRKIDNPGLLPFRPQTHHENPRNPPPPLILFKARSTPNTALSPPAPRPFSRKIEDCPLLFHKNRESRHVPPPGNASSWIHRFPNRLQSPAVDAQHTHLLTPASGTRSARLAPAHAGCNPRARSNSSKCPIRTTARLANALLCFGKVLAEHGADQDALSVLVVALEGFRWMGSKAAECWKDAKPLFERSLQTKAVEEIYRKLARMEESHQANLEKLSRMTAPVEPMQRFDSTERPECPNVGNVNEKATAPSPI